MEFTLTTFVNIICHDWMFIEETNPTRVTSKEQLLTKNYKTEYRVQNWILNTFLKGSETHMLLSVAVQCRLALRRPPEKTKQHWQATGRGETQSHLEK